MDHRRARGDYALLSYKNSESAISHLQERRRHWKYRLDIYAEELSSGQITRSSELWISDDASRRIGQEAALALTLFEYYNTQNEYISSRLKPNPNIPILTLPS
jgi:hypothetical protein